MHHSEDFAAGHGGFAGWTFEGLDRGKVFKLATGSSTPPACYDWLSRAGRDAGHAKEPTRLRLVQAEVT